MNRNQSTRLISSTFDIFIDIVICDWRYRINIIATLPVNYSAPCNLLATFSDV